MSTTLEREVTQIEMREAACSDSNKSEHAAMRRDIKTLSKSIRIGAVVLTLAQLMVPVYDRINAAWANEHITEVAREATRRQFAEMQPKRENELQQIADEAAKRAVSLVTLPQETIRH
jgi:hypothetical protein